MKQVVRSLMLSALAVSAAQATQYGSRTFMAHRDELSCIALDWVGDSHYKVKSDDKSLGATLMVTPFYTQSTKAEKIATLFGQGVTGKIAIKDPSKTNLDGELEGGEIDQAPDADYTTPLRLPMFGTVSFNPVRTAYGARISWYQSLDSMFKGLSFFACAPVEEVSTNMGMTFSGTASNVSTDSGTAGKTLGNYFGGTLTKSQSTSLHVQQEALKKAKLSSTKQSKLGIGDVHLGLQWLAYQAKKIDLSLGLNLVVPTGNTPTNEWAFEPMVGNSNHVALGASVGGVFHATARKNCTVDFTATLDWRYLFDGTEKRVVGVYDSTAGALFDNGHYHLMMQHQTIGVFPGANVLSKECTVTPGHQLDAVAGIAGSFKGVKFNLAYNLFAREQNKVALKEKWSNDTYAFASPYYSVSSTALGTTVLGRTTGGAADTSNPIAKHANVIGANFDGWKLPVIDKGVTVETVAYAKPGGSTSVGGPIQETGAITSALPRQTVNATTGIGSVETTAPGTLKVRYNLTTAPAITEAQLTHSVVGGLSYQFSGDFPVIVGLGGKLEVASSTSNSALENWMVFAKLGVTF